MGQTLYRDMTGQPLDHRVIDAALGVGTAVAEAADRDVDQIRLNRAQIGFAEPQPLHRTRSEVLHEHISAQHQFFENLTTPCGVQIEGYRALAAVGVGEQ